MLGQKNVFFKLLCLSLSLSILPLCKHQFVRMFGLVFFASFVCLAAHLLLVLLLSLTCICLTNLPSSPSPSPSPRPMALLTRSTLSSLCCVATTQTLNCSSSSGYLQESSTDRVADLTKQLRAIACRPHPLPPHSGFSSGPRSSQKRLFIKASLSYPRCECSVFATNDEDDDDTDAICRTVQSAHDCYLDRPNGSDWQLLNYSLSLSLSLP
jgi:hypothetical protein